MKNSRNKGKNGELEFCKLAREHGHTARRSQQFSGDKQDGDPDVIIDTPVAIHTEVKRRESGNIDQWLAQATDDAREGAIPVVAHRRNGEKWKITLSADDFFRLIGKGSEK